MSLLARINRFVTALVVLQVICVLPLLAQSGTESEQEGCKQCQWLIGTCTYCPSGYSTGWWNCYGSCAGWCSVSNQCEYALETGDVNADGGLAIWTEPQAMPVNWGPLVLANGSVLREQFERNCKGIVIGRHYTSAQGALLRQSSRIFRL